MMGAKTFLIAVITVTILEIHCQTLELFGKSLFECHKSNGWQTHGAESKNAGTCYSEKCLGFFSFSDLGQSKIVDLNGCNIPRDLMNYLRSYMIKYQTNSGKQTGKIRMEIAGLTLHTQYNLKNLEGFIQKLQTQDAFSANVNLNLNIDGVKMEARVSIDSEYPEVLPNEVEVCKDQKCETMEMQDFLPIYEEIFKKMKSGEKLTMTYGPFGPRPFKYELCMKGNPNGLIKKFTNKSIDRFETDLSADCKIEDLLSAKIALHGSTSANELISKYEQFLQIYSLYAQGDSENLVEYILPIFHDIAANFCIEEDCIQFGACSEKLCNTQENFIKKANSGVTLKIAFISIALNLFSYYLI
jgi:hypothetical protein